MATKRTWLNVRCDDEYNAEEFFALMDDAFPSVMVQLRHPGTATISSDQWEAIQKLDGFQSGMTHAPTALIVVDDDEPAIDLDKLAAALGYEEIKWDSADGCYSGFGSSDPFDRSRDDAGGFYVAADDDDLKERARQVL